MQKFSLDPNNERLIRHNIPPEMLIQVIVNNSEAYDEWEDVYELFEFRGNKIVVKWHADDSEINEIEDYSHIRSILRRAWSWYRNQVYIEKYTTPAGAMETERFILQASEKEPEQWVVTDKKNMISIVFENHRFNDTQKIVEYENFNTEIIPRLPRILREIGDWLAKNHYDKVF